MSKLALSQSFTIQPATLMDVDQLVELEQASFAVPWSRQSFEVEIQENQFGSLFIAQNLAPSQPNHKVLGYICFWSVFEELRFMNLAVMPGNRRMGIGSALVKFALGNGIQQGTRRALLEVRASNRPGIKLYNRFEFERYGIRKGYYTNPEEDAILMILDPIPSHYA